MNTIKKEIESTVVINSKRGGKLFEMFIILEIIKKIASMKKRWDLYHWRTLDNHEVDLIIEKTKNELIAIEIKATENPTIESAKHLITFASEFKSAKLMILSTAKLPFSLNKGRIEIDVYPYLDGIDEIFSN